MRFEAGEIQICRWERTPREHGPDDDSNPKPPPPPTAAETYAQELERQATTDVKPEALSETSATPKDAEDGTAATRIETTSSAVSPQAPVAAVDPSKGIASCTPQGFRYIVPSLGLRGRF